MNFNFEHTYASLPKDFYTYQNPVKVTSPSLVLFNDDLAQSIGLDFANIKENEKDSLFSGNILPTGSKPLVQAYAGHQFGHFTILGDGRAVLLGEHVMSSGQRVDIQFKGSGRTAYSRRGDGRAALGPMLREYIISEAMYALGIPTTRSLAVVKTGEPIFRGEMLLGAVLTRVASSHIRVGTFEYASAMHDKGKLQALFDYTLNRHMPHLKDAENKALSFLRHVMEKQIKLIVSWMRVGFIHGVMNTDNMAISGETMDYGPCAFMDSYNPDDVFSSIDHQGRYAFSNQPFVAQWNIAKLAEALIQLIDSNKNKSVTLAEKLINEFPALYKKKWLEMMCAKLGLFSVQEGDDVLISDLLKLMKKNSMDYTNTFRGLSDQNIDPEENHSESEFNTWKYGWRKRLQENKRPLDEAFSLMKANNPSVIPRNHIVENVLSKANDGDLEPLKDFLTVLQKPYEDLKEQINYKVPPKNSNRVYQTFCGT